MNIHLFRSGEVDLQKFFNVVDYLSGFPGLVKFITHEQPASMPGDLQFDKDWDQQRILEQEDFVNEMELKCDLASPKIVSWSTIFTQIRKIRSQGEIDPAEPVVLITDLRNDMNWFSAGDSNDNLDFFIHSGMWEWYIDGDPRYPIAYELIILPLRIKMFDTFQGFTNYMHRETRGCMNDFCRNKKDIGFKLRSADICPECLEIIQKRKIDPLLLQQSYKVMDDIRSQLLFRERFKFTLQPSKMRIAGRLRRLYLTDLGNLEIYLTPMEKTVYLFFLNHPEGVEFSYMPDHIQEIRKIYEHVSNTDIIALLENRTNAICTNQGDCLGQIVSRIRFKFVKELGETLAGPYLISGSASQKRKIKLDRSLVEFID
jgi:hypothetical protein